MVFALVCLFVIVVKANEDDDSHISQAYRMRFAQCLTGDAVIYLRVSHIRHQ